MCGSSSTTSREAIGVRRRLGGAAGSSRQNVEPVPGPGAFGIGAAAVPLGRALDDEQAEAGALDALGQRAGHAVEALEDALGFDGGRPGAAVAHAQHARGRPRERHRDVHVDVIAGELHGVVEQVQDRAAQLVRRRP